MLPLKKSLVMLSILVSLIIIIDYNVQGMIVPGHDNSVNGWTLSNVTTTNSLKVSHSHSPLHDHTLFSTIHMLRFLNPKLLVKVS